MNKHFKLLLEVLTFGTPLFIRVLSRARKLQAIIDGKVDVTVIKFSDKWEVELNFSSKTNLPIVLRVDRLVDLSNSGDTSNFKIRKEHE